jgi:hypothetical protein
MTNQAIYNSGVTAFEQGKPRSDNPWDGNKAGASREAHGVWDRAWTDTEKKAKKLTTEDVQVGSFVAEMHGHETNSGILKGWKVTNLFEISEGMAAAMLQKLREETESKKLPVNKYAYAVGVFERLSDDIVTSVLVVYIYDHQYYIATLQLPS